MSGPAGAQRVLVSLLVVVLAGCGVQVQQEAQPLPSGALQSPTQTVEPIPTPTARETTIYFVSGPLLEGVREQVADRSADGVMAALLAGPPVVQQAELRSLLLDPLTSTPILKVVGVTPSGEVTLQSTDAFQGMPATDQVLLVGQVVHSMAEVGLSRVVVTEPMGAQMNLALPDGRSVVGAVTAEDYASLLAAPAGT